MDVGRQDRLIPGHGVIIGDHVETLHARRADSCFDRSRSVVLGVIGPISAQAMSYLRDRAALAEHEITTEIDRCIAWPGQALAYRLGELQIRRHRREAEEKLGARFDQRRFHDAILAIGSVPLPVLEQHMERFIADESVRAEIRPTIART